MYGDMSKASYPLQQSIDLFPPPYFYFVSIIGDDVNIQDLPMKLPMFFLLIVALTLLLPWDVYIDDGRLSLLAIQPQLFVVLYVSLVPWLLVLALGIIPQTCNTFTVMGSPFSTFVCHYASRSEVVSAYSFYSYGPRTLDMRPV